MALCQYTMFCSKKESILGVLGVVCFFYLLLWINVNERQTRLSVENGNASDMTRYSRVMAFKYPDRVECRRLDVSWDAAPRTNVMFLKTHKTGGSTLQNIFLRFADRENLTIALGQKNHLLGYPRTFSKAYKEGVLYYSNRFVYDMVTHHARYDNNIKRFLAKDAVFVSILRDPVETSESYFRYFEMEQIVRKHMNNSTQDPLEFFLDRSIEINDDFLNMHFRNIQLFDFGLDFKVNRNKSLIRDTIQTIEKNFHLIMIAEYFDESLILLKHLLNWKLEDLVYLKQNVRVERLRSPLTKNITEKLRKFGEGDGILYDYFNKTFWKKINQICPVSFNKELAKFRELNEYWTNFCVTGYQLRADMKSQGHQAGMQASYGYKQNNATRLHPMCIALTTAEIPYTRYFTKKLLNTGQLSKEMANCTLNDASSKTGPPTAVPTRKPNKKGAQPSIESPDEKKPEISGSNARQKIEGLVRNFKENKTLPGTWKIYKRPGQNIEVGGP